MLKYVGNGQFLIGVPNRDLSEQEINDLGLDREVLLRSGLYKEVKDAKHSSEHTDKTEHDN